MVLISAALGLCLAKNKINLIYGGGSVGLMGTVAKTVAEGGCEVTGFLPEFFVQRSKPSWIYVYQPKLTLVPQCEKLGQCNTVK